MLLFRRLILKASKEKIFTKRSFFDLVVKELFLITSLDEGAEAERIREIFSGAYERQPLNEGSTHLAKSPSAKIVLDPHLKNEHYSANAASKFKVLEHFDKEEKMFMIMGPHMSGKTVLLDKYIQAVKENTVAKKVVLNPSSNLKMWNSNSDCFKQLEVEDRRTFLVFDCDFSESNFYSYDLLLENQQLYYDTGEKINLPENVRTVFEVANTEHMKPSAFCRIRQVYLGAC